MAPFMDPRQDLGRLMSKVLALDVTNSLRQLETVNANITLIRLWFSRAEVSRLGGGGWGVWGGGHILHCTGNYPTCMHKG